jgi:hypothetical protein
MAHVGEVYTASRPDRRVGGPGGIVLTMTFLDRRPAGGLRVPYHTSAAGDRSVDELSFGEIVANAPLSKTDFAGS